MGDIHDNKHPCRILKVRFSSMVEVRDFRVAIEALPPFEKKVVEEKKEGLAEEKKKEEEKKEGEGEEKKEGTGEKDDGKRKITVTLYSEHSTDSECPSFFM